MCCGACGELAGRGIPSLGNPSQHLGKHGITVYDIDGDIMKKVYIKCFNLKKR